MFKSFVAASAAVLFWLATLAPVSVVAKEAGEIVVRFRAALVIPVKAVPPTTGRLKLVVTPVSTPTSCPRWTSPILHQKHRRRVDPGHHNS